MDVELPASSAGRVLPRTEFPLLADAAAPATESQPIDLLFGLDSAELLPLLRDQQRLVENRSPADLGPDAADTPDENAASDAADRPDDAATVFEAAADHSVQLPIEDDVAAEATLSGPQSGNPAAEPYIPQVTAEGSDMATSFSDADIDAVFMMRPALMTEDQAVSVGAFAAGLILPKHRRRSHRTLLLTSDVASDGRNPV